MYYTYRKARSLSSSLQVHIQPMKTFRSLFQVSLQRFSLEISKQFSSDECFPDLCMFHRGRWSASAVILDFSSFDNSLQLAVDNNDLLQPFISCEIDLWTVDGEFSRIRWFIFCQSESNGGLPGKWRCREKKSWLFARSFSIDVWKHAKRMDRWSSYLIIQRSANRNVRTIF